MNSYKVEIVFALYQIMIAKGASWGVPILSTTEEEYIELSQSMRNVIPFMVMMKVVSSIH